MKQVYKFDRVGRILLAESIVQLGNKETELIS